MKRKNKVAKSERNKLITEEDYVHQLNLCIDTMMFLASCNYREDGPLGKVDYDFMYDKLTPERLAPIINLVEIICQKFDLAYPARKKTTIEQRSFKDWYEQTCGRLEIGRMVHADAIFDRIAKIEKTKG